MLATMDPRAHHQAIARAVRLRGRGRAAAPRSVVQTEPINGPRRIQHGKVPILPIDPTTALVEVISKVGTALDRASRAVVCVTCDRRLCRPNRGDRPQAIFKNGEPMLAEEDWCRWCARPISERGEELTPKDGFLQIVIDAGGGRDRDVAVSACAEELAWVAWLAEMRL